MKLSAVILILVNILIFIGTFVSCLLFNLTQTEIDMAIIFGMAIIPAINTMLYFSMKGGR